MKKTTLVPLFVAVAVLLGLTVYMTFNEEMKKFAEDIIRFQSEEIKPMTTWLEAWYPEEEHDIDYQPMMRNLDYIISPIFCVCHALEEP